MTGNHHRPGPLARADAWLIRTSAVAWFNLKAVWAIPGALRAERRKAKEDRERLERQARDAQSWTLAEARDPATDNTVPAEDLTFIETLRNLPRTEKRLVPPGARVPEQRQPEAPDWLAEQLTVVYDWANNHEARLATLGHIDEQVAA